MKGSALMRSLCCGTRLGESCTEMNIHVASGLIPIVLGDSRRCAAPSSTNKEQRVSAPYKRFALVIGH